MSDSIHGPGRHRHDRARGPESNGPWFPRLMLGQLRGGGPALRRGGIRPLILAALAQKPMHGYEVIQSLEAESGGRWRPSAGSVYPSLQQLADEGLVTSGSASSPRRTRSRMPAELPSRPRPSAARPGRVERTGTRSTSARSPCSSPPPGCRSSAWVPRQPRSKPAGSLPTHVGACTGCSLMTEQRVSPRATPTSARAHRTARRRLADARPSLPSLRTALTFPPNASPRPSASISPSAR